MEKTVYIDGSFGEGGGQIIRTAVSLAAITGRTVEIGNIRANRSKPGLQAQHLTAVRAAGDLCGAVITGDQLGATHLRFEPGKGGSCSEFAWDVASARHGSSAGAGTLVCQTMLLPALTILGGCAWAASICGGTHVPMAPTSEYLEFVYLPHLQRMGFDASIVTKRVGFYPRGGGELAVTAGGTTILQPIHTTRRGRLIRLAAYVTTSGLPETVAQRAGATIRKELSGFGVEIDVIHRNLESNGTGAAITLTAEYQDTNAGWTSLGERGKPVEAVAREAVEPFKKWHSSGAGVDPHMADQLVLPCTLVAGQSQWSSPSYSEHLRTVLWVASRFVPLKYYVSEDSAHGYLVSLESEGLI